MKFKENLGVKLFRGIGRSAAVQLGDISSINYIHRSTVNVTQCELPLYMEVDHSKIVVYVKPYFTKECGFEILRKEVR